MRSTRRFRGVCIGAGYFSHFHHDAWQRIPRVEIVATSDRDGARAKAIADKFGLTQRYADWREMFDRERPDFVDVITPPPSHAEMCAEAARRGIHIICQKPLAPTLDQARSIVDNAAKARVRLMVHENFRFQPWHREIKRQIETGVIGNLFSLAFRSRMGDGWGADAYIQRQPYFRDYPRLLVYETGLHFIDTFRYLGGEITRVTAWLRRLNPVINGEDCGLLVFEFANGAIGQWDASRYNEPSCPQSKARYTFGEFLVEGSEGSLRLYLDGRLTLTKLGGEEREIRYPHKRRGFAGDCVYAIQRHFIECMLDGRPFETSGEDYLITTAIQEAAYRSADRRTQVEIRQMST